MNKLLKSILISLFGAIVMIFLSGCTPGKAQVKGNDYRGSFQNEEFEAFDNGNSANDDVIPPMNKNKSVSSDNRYADNGKNNSNKNMRVKSANENSANENSGYKEARGKYSDSEEFEYEADNTANKGYNARQDQRSNNEPASDRFYQKGMASWYGREFQGKTTASGEVFDMNNFTAAHKTLPFGTIVEVKNLENGKSVKLKINDRGPYRGNRIIDLSFGGAREIGMIKNGEVNVGIKVLKMGDNSTYGNNSGKKYIEPVADDDSYANVKSENRQEYSDSIKLQAGAFYSRKNADKLKSKIEGMTERPVRVIQDGDYFKVRVEGFRDKKEMGRLKSMLGEENISSFSVE